MISIFKKPNLVLIVEGHEIHVEKTELFEKAPGFKKMLTSNVEEKDAETIVLPEQKLADFLTFLRCTLSGIGQRIDVHSARTIIPIAHAYQAEYILKSAENVLQYNCTTDDLSSEIIIQDIILAEKCDLKLYLGTLIECASKKMFCFFSKAKGYNEISKKTLLSIALKRWEDNINPIDGRSMIVNPDTLKIEKLEIDPKKERSTPLTKAELVRQIGQGTAYVENRVRPFAMSWCA